MGTPHTDIFGSRMDPQAFKRDKFYIEGRNFMNAHSFCS